MQVSLPFTGTDPATGLTITSIPAGGTVTISYQVQVHTTPPIPTPITNVATVSVPGGPTGTTNAVTTQVRTAALSLVKSGNRSFVEPGDIITYSIALTNMGNVSANNVVLTDTVPAGTTFVPGSVTGATGTPPTLTLLAPIAPMASSTVTFKVLVGNSIPVPNPIVNSATFAYTYTGNPNQPNGATRDGVTNTVSTLISSAALTLNKAVDAAFAKAGDVLKYTLTLTNTGNVAADTIVITDAIPAGTTFVSGSVIGANGIPPTLTLPSPIAPGASTIVSFEVLVSAGVPVVNPIPNSASAQFRFTIDPNNPDGEQGTTTSNTVTTLIQNAIIETTKQTNDIFVATGDIITYTLTLKNTGNTASNNVVITDVIPSGTTYVAGSVTGATGTPPTFTLLNPIQAGATAIVTFQVQVGATIPSPNPINNQASVAFTYTINPANPNSENGTSLSNIVSSLVSTANVTIAKSVTPPIAMPNDILQYTLTLTNTGNTVANQVIITDALPAGTTFVTGSLIDAIGTLPTLTQSSPIPVGGSVVVSYQLKVGNAVPASNPVQNIATINYKYTTYPNNPNGNNGNNISNIVQVPIRLAQLQLTKAVDLCIAYIGDMITYSILLKNTGNVPLDNIVLQDTFLSSVQVDEASLIVSVPFTGSLLTSLQLTNPLAPQVSVTLSFKVQVIAMPNPNPIMNTMQATYTYTLDPNDPDGEEGSIQSNAVSTIVYRHNYAQQISDIIQSVSLEQAALANLANAEGAKIQAMVADETITTQELLCLNKSVEEMLASITMLEHVLIQKLRALECQIECNASQC